MDREVLDAQDAKLVTLARGARGRIGATGGAAVRDDMGRTYSAADIALPSLTLSALQLAVAQAVMSGASSLEAAALVQQEHVPIAGLAAVCDLGGEDVPLYVCEPNGQVRRVTTAGQAAIQ
jgi:cytidine deaminase